jgi:hypothetical protein
MIWFILGLIAVSILSLVILLGHYIYLTIY